MSSKPEIFKAPTMSDRANQLLREVKWIVLALLGVTLLAMLVSFDVHDPSFFQASSGQVGIQNWVGSLGAWVSAILLYVFGLSAYWWVLLCAWAIYRGMRRTSQMSLLTVQERAVFKQQYESKDALLYRLGFIVVLLTSVGLEYMHTVGWNVALPYEHGGVLGEAIAKGLTLVIGQIFATLFLAVLFAAGLSWLFNFSWLSVSERIGEAIEKIVLGAWSYFDKKQDVKVGVEQVAVRERELAQEKIRAEKTFPVHIEPPAPPVVQSTRSQKEKQTPLFAELSNSSLPELALLDVAERNQESVAHETLEFNSRLIEKKLRDFGVEVQVVAAYPGPVVTRYEIEPATGVKGSQIVNLSKDLARSLALVSIRVVETIPGKNYMALELPNPKRQIVRLSEIIGSQVYHDASSLLTVALGKDIGGNPVVADLAKMPHLLVAGTTGSGKSVGINTMILSLLYRATPEQVRLILIDPKMLEMSVYADIAHLLCPVVTDMRQAGHALNWVVGEMERRYKLMSVLGARGVAGFNKKIDEAHAKGEHIANPFSLTPDAPEPLEKMPLIVVVIDELADLMMVVGKKIEELIARIAQKARAAGIHLILATQRPSVDVITGLIKANVPTRIAFQVSSKIDSRTILDQQGAEALLGQGDMLYLPPGSGLPVRVHGAFASDEEVIRVAEFLKAHSQPNYIEDVLTGGAGENGEGGEDADGEADPLYDQAVAFIVRTQKASISSVQREFRIGYNRSARLLEQMERSGVVSPMQSNGSREILAPKHSE
ncbi:MAG: DNA translocase FtsK 4TM domain-containing protein [Hydromonas sp.]|nr:DNA translocase FtsK 4TM domain-containing protein [Hydromonas sp.]MBP6294202.1 DNA translocase FtsK 4TM domain-containing protein [Hydromonas sp.]